MTMELAIHEYHIDRLEYMKRLVTKCHVKRKMCGSQYVERGIV